MPDSNKIANTPESKNGLLLTIAVSLWVSFLSAGLATMLFFSAFDPAVISEVATFPMTLDRTAGYSIGFLLFWALLFINSAIIALVSKRPPEN